MVKFCKVSVKRSVKYCGAFSHRKDKPNGEAKFLRSVSADECKRMHSQGTYNFWNNIIPDLKVNTTSVHPLTIVGKIDQDGNCDQAGDYRDPYGAFTEVIVTGYLTITLVEYEATVNLNTNEIILKSGTRCTLTKNNCVDPEYGDAYWETIPPTTCNFKRYAQLFAGEVNKIIEKGKELTPVYMMESSEVTFAFMALGKEVICGYNLIRTEHPKLFFLEGIMTETFEAVRVPSISNLDIFAYVNSKFIYVEKHIKGQLKRLYRDMLMQKCELERRVIANALSIAAAAPDLFAYQITKQSGYIGIVAGEVVHLMQCIQVEVNRREEKSCYQELPVTKDGVNYFLTPRTHILKTYGTETTCNPLIPPMFQLEDQWYTVLPNSVTKGITPNILKPSIQPTWNYTDPNNLARSGIYTIEQIQALRQHLMFPVERPAVLNSIAMSIAGRSSRMDGLSIARLFDEDALSKLAESTWGKIWGRFLSFGSVSAGVIGIFMIARIIKFSIDTIVHGYALHSIYGWSIFILASVWNSVTHLLIHLGNRKQQREGDSKNEKKIEEKEDIDQSSGLWKPPPPQPPPRPPPPTLPAPNAPGANINGPGESPLRYTVRENRLYPLLQENSQKMIKNNYEAEV